MKIWLNINQKVLKNLHQKKIFEKGWLEITKKSCLFGCIGLPVFLGIISAIISPNFTLWGPIEDVNQPKLMNPQVEEIE